jgi:hypothetical protein
MLARHVVRARRHGAERRATEHELQVAKANQIRKVGMAAGKLRHVHGTLRMEADDVRGKALAEVRFHSRPVEPFALAYGAGIVRVQSSEFTSSRVHEFKSSRVHEFL